MGYDSFGLPTENFALKSGGHPMDITAENIKAFRSQLDQLGGMYDWESTVTTSDVSYYKWTQWLFIELFKAGLAYRGKKPVNWCDGCQTIIANEQVVEEKCERCSTKVEERDVDQWFFKITDFKQALIDGLDKVDFPSGTKMMQRNWIAELRDWSVSRQRYWGAPIPIIYCDKCGMVADENLPVVLPRIDDFKPKGAPPLANAPDFVNTTCPKCKGAATRETETMDTFVCSSWYFLRYPFATNKDADKLPFDNSVRPVDVYVGGAEHACGHLIYARFITKVLHKLGYIDFDEPFKRLIHQGMILAPDGQKMSKSKGNTISPDKYIAEFGSDIVRLYMLFGFSYVEGGPWDDGALKAMVKFVQRVDRLVRRTNDNTPDVVNDETCREILHKRAKTIKAVREDLDGFSFNTAVARCMEFTNALYSSKVLSKASVVDLVLMMAPMVPATAQQWWKVLAQSGDIFDQPFPTFQEEYLEKFEVEIAVQVNSKIKDRIVVPTNATQEQIEEIAKEKIGNDKVKKVIYVAGKLINFILWPLPPI